MKKILLVEDEEVIARELKIFLDREGFNVRWVTTGVLANCEMQNPIDLVLVDWMLPDIAGIDLIRKWRANGLQTPIILITARSELIDKVLGLELGADDYITKPFEARELLARIHVQLRRDLPLAATHTKNPPLEASSVRIAQDERQVYFKGIRIDMTKMEFDLLKLLLENHGKVFTREELLNRVWGFERYPTTRTVDTHVLQLRQKLSPALIETVRGIGYRFCNLEKT